ncbi:MAG TPA: winged helix-turn-helix domain-containing protein [Bryobacteraceae bacterium]|nr:winged helix-turn-helix domain-containing protein [Bryobacteraceae bacterium]
MIAFLCYTARQKLVAPQSEFSLLLKFGPFEVNRRTGELKKNGVRVRLSGQPSRILLILLENPGKLTTREELRERIWDEGTFVDFEGGLNAAMNKLRRALNDSADKPRYIETVPSLGYRFIAHIDVHEPTAAAPGAAGAMVQKTAASSRRGRRFWPLYAAIVLIGAGSLLAWRLNTTRDAQRPWKITQLTVEAGVSEEPALSPDGKLVAYSSDRSPEGGRDLYVQQVPGGQPIRLTSDGTGNTTPDFSPDGSRIVFRSNRDGGGIYVIPALGGEARLLAKDGRNPKFSPDGSQVAYWVGAPHMFVAVPGSGAVWVVAATGGSPRRVAPEFTDARHPVWSPDGKHLLIDGYASNRVFDRSALDWWVAPVDGGTTVRSGLYDALERSGLKAWDTDGPVKSLPLPDDPTPGCWLAAGGRVIFSGVIGGATDIWEAAITPAGKIIGDFRRLTAGASNALGPSCSSTGAVAFMNSDSRQDIWLLSLDPNSGMPGGAPQRATSLLAVHEYATLSGDGRYVVFGSTQSGRINVWRRELATGKETQVADSTFIHRFPVISPSGRRIAYSADENGRRFVYATTSGGAPEKLCEGCLRATDWSNDEKTVLTFGGNPYQINLLDVVSHAQSALLRHPTRQVLFGRFSADNQWVSFTERIAPGRARINVAHLDGRKPIPESVWIPIAEGGSEDWANWSDDDKILYFTSGRDGYACLWGQRLDAISRRPAGEAFPVQHFHGPLYYGQEGWSAIHGRIAIALREDAGNIWMMSRADAR